MKRIADQKKLQNILLHYGFQDIFGTLDLPFFLVEFERGDSVNSLLNPHDHLIFLLSGAASIYHVRSDGTTTVLYSSRNHFSCLGDMEFAKADSTQFETEITSDAMAVVLPLHTCRESLTANSTFLLWLLRSLAEKLDASGIGNVESISLDRAVLYFMRTHGGWLRKPGIAAGLLHCSRRQLQRILSRLQADGMIEKTGRGCYRCTEKGALTDCR